MNSQKIKSLATPTQNTDAATKSYIDTNFYLNTTTLNAIASATADLDISSYKIINLANATAATDALNRQTADGRYYP